MIHPNPPARRERSSSFLFVIIVPAIAAGLVMLHVPVIGWFVGALLLMAFLLVLNALRERQDIHSQESPLRWFFLTLRDMVGGTLVVWICGLVMAAGMVVFLPAGVLQGLQSFKRRLILRVFRQQAALTAVTVTSMPELERLRPGRHFLLTASVRFIDSKFRMPVDVLYCEPENGAKNPPPVSGFMPYHRVHPKIILALSDGEFTGVLRGAIVLNVPESSGEDKKSATWLALKFDDAVAVSGQVALREESDLQKRRYLILRVVSIQPAHRLTAAEMGVLTSRTP